jgi:hypothetical protein
MNLASELVDGNPDFGVLLMDSLRTSSADAFILPESGTPFKNTHKEA